jgi:hypothetical protein
MAPTALTWHEMHGAQHAGNGTLGSFRQEVEGGRTLEDGHGDVLNGLRTHTAAVFAEGWAW